jgi:hypothetical protein
MNWFGGAGKIIGKVNEIHEKFIEVHTEFKLLRHQTEGTLAEFKHALERLASKVESIQLEQTKAHAELKAEIRGLELRMNALSEQAFHAVADKAFRESLQAKTSGTGVPAGLLPPPKRDE